MSFINPLHIAFVAIVALLVLGPKRFPEVARSIGNGYREFREQLSAVTQQAHVDLTAPAAGTPTMENASVVEQISPDRETVLAPPDHETTVTAPHVAPPAPGPAVVAEPADSGAPEADVPPADVAAAPPA